MANNTETYTVVIDTEVKGDGSLENLSSQVETTGNSFTKLQLQIRQTQKELQAAAAAGDDVKFNKLKGELDELEEGLEKVQFKSKQFDDQLASLPGPAGAAGNAMKGLDGIFKVFVANPILAVITAIVGIFLALKESLNRTEEGQAKLTKVTEGFTKILNGLFAVLEPIANFFIDLVISLLENEKVLNGLSIAVGVLSAAFQVLFNVGKGIVDIVINNLIIGFRTLIDVGSAAGKVLKGVFTLDLALINEGLAGVKKAYVAGVTDVVNNVVTGAKNIADGVVDGITSGFDAGVGAFNEGSKRLTEAEKEAEKKRNEDAKKAAEERKKLVEEAEKLQTEIVLALLDERSAELIQRETKFNEDKKKLIAGGITDLTQLEELYNKDVEAINKKYEDIARTNRINGIQTRFNQIVSATNAGFDELIALVTEKEDELLANTQLTEDERTQIQLDAIAERKSILEKQYGDELLGLDLQFQLVLNTNVEDYDELLNEINQKEAELLSNTELNETQRLDIQKEFARQRAEIGSIDYDALISIIDEKERILLSNTQLTANERLAIERDFAQQRADIRGEELNERILALDNESNLLFADFERRKQIVTEQEAIILELEGRTEAQRTAIRQQASAQRTAIDREEVEAKRALENEYIQIVSDFGALLTQVAGKSKGIAITGIIVQQAASIAKIIANTSAAIAALSAGLPFTAPSIIATKISAGIGIASTIASAAKAISTIKSTPGGSGGAGSAGSPSVGGVLSTPISTPSVGSTTAPTITGTDGGTSPTQQITQTLSQRDKRPVRAYVVSGEVTSQQALDRRTNRAATFGGG